MKFFNCALLVKAVMLLTLPQSVMAEPLASYSPPILMASSRHDTSLLQLTNNQRSQAGVAPLCFSPELGEAAQRHAEDMVRNNFFSHTGSNGSSIGDRAEANGYSYSRVGENIAAGNASPAGTITQWMNSSGHRQNILNPNYTEIGFGYVEAPGSQYGHYWVQVFGNPRGGSTCTEPNSSPNRSNSSANVPNSNVFNRIETGVLNSGDDTLDDGSPYDFYSFEGVAGQQVTISLSSSDFDAYLMLIHSGSDFSVHNDDATDNTFNSELELTLPSSGTYWIVATTYDPAGRGRYTLTIN